MLPGRPSVWGPAMDLQVRIPPPVHYLIQQQASSLLAVQELRKDVDVLLEFREQVLGSLPHLTASGAQGEPEGKKGTELSSKRHYPSLDDDISPRHNSSFDSGRSRKYDATVVDSGFSTETKEAQSRGEDELWLLLETIHRRGTRLKELAQSKPSDTLYQRSYKPGRVRKYERKPKMDADKLGAIQEDTKSPAHQFSSLPVGGNFDLVASRSIGSDVSVAEYASGGSDPKLIKVSLNEQVCKLRSERDAWMRKVAEASDSKKCIGELQKQIQTLVSEKKVLEEQLQETLAWKDEIQNMTKNGLSKDTLMSSQETHWGVDGLTKKIPGISVSWTEKEMETDSLNSHPIKPVLLDVLNPNPVSIVKDKTPASFTQKKPSSLFPRSVLPKDLLLDEGTRWHSEENLPRKQPSSGEHHSSSSARQISLPVEKVHVKPNKRKVSAILQENDVISLRRQLLTYVQGYELLKAQWEASAKQLEETDKQWRNQVSSINTENDDLRFQLEEKNIELEGTRARLRVLEKLLGTCGPLKMDRGTDPATPSLPRTSTPKKHKDLLHVNQESSEESSSTESLKARTSTRRTFHKNNPLPEEVYSRELVNRPYQSESSPTKKTIQRSSSRDSDSSSNSHHGKVSNFVSKRNAKNLEGAQGKKPFVRSIEREQQKNGDCLDSFGGDSLDEAPVILAAPFVQYEPNGSWDLLTHNSSMLDSPLAHIEVALQWTPEQQYMFMKRA